MPTIFETSSFLILAAIIDILVAAHILLNKNDQPVSATLWLFIVFSFPLFGVVLYLFLGINRIKTLGLKVALANEKVTAEQKNRAHTVINSIFNETKQFVAKEYKNSTDSLEYNRAIDNLLPQTFPLTGNRVELLRDGTAAYPKMLAAIKEAQHNIHLQSFIINNDAIGTEILDALTEKAKQGIKVKVLYDKFGSTHAVASHFFRKYKTSKIDNFQMHSFSIANVFAPWRVQLRNHRKALVIDGKIAFVGGINISSENDINTCNKEKYIHDLHCKLEGPAVIPLQLDFLRDWFYATKTKLSTLLQAEYFPGPKQIGDATVRIISSGPGQQEAATEKVFLAAIATAKEYLLIMTPYFMPDQPIMKALSTASARGVDIRIILPKRNNHWYVQFASRSLYPFLLQNNIRVFEKHGVFSHTKAMVADDNWGQMGSSNWDVRSLRLNYELDFIVEDEGFIFDLKQQFLNELTESEEILLEQVQNKKLARQLVENFCALFTPVL